MNKHKTHPIPLGDGYHELRHFYASVLIRAGESVKVVQKRLGHSSAQMTLDIYAHLWPEDDETTRAALDAVFANRGRSPEGYGDATCPTRVTGTS